MGGRPAQVLTQLYTSDLDHTGALARRMMWRGLGMAHPMDAHKADSRAMFSRGQSADAVEGVTSFLEKRPASYPDRVSGGLPDLGLEDPEWS